jgi:phenylacetic acid degradation operon negative regulatory protein
MLQFSFAVLNSRNAVDVLALRPLSARSVVLSVLLGTHPPRLPVSALVALGGEFGIAPGTIRTAVSRMVTAGDLVASDGGYALTGRLLARQREQDVGRTVASHQWDGQWWVVTTLDTRRAAADRREFRTAMEGAKLGELRPDTWLRPTNLPVTSDRSDVLVTRGELDHSRSGELVGRLWDLPALERRARDLLDGLDAVAGQLDADTSGAGIAPGFTVLAGCLRFLRVEPQLPEELVPPGSANALRTRYPEVEDALQRRLRQLFRNAR